MTQVIAPQKYLSMKTHIKEITLPPPKKKISLLPFSPTPLHLFFFKETLR